MSAGPPLASAATHTARYVPDVPMMRMCPEPICLNRTACRAVVKPLMSRAEKTAHEM